MSYVIRFAFLGIIIAGLGFLIYYKFFWNKRILKQETMELLRSNGIADRPETIVRRYYKAQGKSYSEKEVKKLTGQYMENNKDFFLTMWENIKPKDNKKNG